MSEVRERLNELGTKDELTAEERVEISDLTGQYRTLESRGRALAISQEEEVTTPEATDPSKAELVDRASVADIFSAVTEQRDTDGATRELQDEHGLRSHMIPLELLEERAVTPAPAAGSRGATQAPIIPAVFPDSASSFLNVPQPRVPVGDRVYAVLTTSAAPGTPAKGAAQAETTGAFTAKVLTPGRIQASFFYAIEDSAVFAGMDTALRQNLRDALADKLDERVLNNLLTDGTAVDLTGTSPATYATFHNALYSAVDGRYASGVGQVRAVMASDMYAFAAGLYRTTQSERSAIDELMMRGGGVRVSAHIPALDSSTGEGKAIYRTGSRMDAVAPVWQGIRLIRDEITKASTGEIVITAVMLYAVDTLRPAPIRIVAFDSTS
ncbi:MAG: hypothetical protein OXM88_12855 [bacterium]|nr:hypothetical protein [bacterium]